MPQSGRSVPRRPRPASPASSPFSPAAGNNLAPASKTIQYPKLPSLASASASTSSSGSQLRQPSRLTLPSYAASPLRDPAIRSPANIGRKRTNAITLVEAPARQGHGDRISQIFEGSRQAVQQQDNVHTVSTEQQHSKGTQISSTMLPRIPPLAPLSRLSEDVSCNLGSSKEHEARKGLGKVRRGPVTPRVDREAAGGQEQQHSPVESWLQALPRPTLPSVSTTRASSLHCPQTPSANVHRLCSSASSIAQRIRLRSPSPNAGTSTTITEEASPHHPTSLLARLLQPPIKPSSKQVNKLALATEPYRSKKCAKTPMPSKSTSDQDRFPVRNSTPDCGSTSSSESDSSETVSELGNRYTAPPQARPNTISRSRTNDKSIKSTKELTPEVSVFRKGKGQGRARC